MIEREFTPDAEVVELWEKLSQTTCDGRVPEVLLTVPFTSMVASMDGDCIIGSITAVRFRDVALVGEPLSYSAEEVGTSSGYRIFDFEIRDEERGVLVANGSFSVVER